MMAVSAVAALATAISLSFQWRGELSSEYASKGTALADSIASAAVFSLLHQDPATVQSQLDEALQIDGVKYLFVTDKNGDVICHTFVPRIPPEVRNLSPDSRAPMATSIRFGEHDYIDVSAPILGGHVGFVHVGMDYGQVEASARRAVAWQSALIGCVFSGAAAVAFVLVRKILQPIAQLTALADRAAAHQDHLELSPISDELQPACKRADEVGQLARAFFRMVMEVTARTRDLICANEHLESRVQQRTSELTASNSQLTEEIAERRRAEEEMRKAKMAAEEASRAKSEFLANMSHEIRTPMNGILGMSDLALRANPSDDQRRYLDAVKVSAESLLRIINDILDFSKIEAGRLDIEVVDFSLRELMTGTMRTLAVRAHEKHIELAWHVHSDVPDMLLGDPVRVRQILLNLAGNAIKFTERGEVVVRVSLRQLEAGAPANPQGPDNGSAAPPGGLALIRFSISDTGIGIPADKIERIFDPFEQADGSTTRRFGGTGLGLTICARLASMMGGRIVVESVPDRGSTFHFEAPFGRSQREPAPQHSGPPVLLRGLPVLVIDDNATNRHILKVLLEDWKMVPTLAESGAEGLARLAAAAQAGTPFRVLLLDVQMPEMDGFMVAEKIRQLYSSLTIIMLTSIDQGSGSARCSSLNIAAHLVKPVSPLDLLESIVRSMRLQAHEALSDNLLVASPQPFGSKLDILLAEDNEVNQIVAAEMLKTRGHKVVVVCNGKEALAALSNHRFDLVLMDIQMPEMDGFDATEAIRHQESANGGHLPIIGLTAHAMKGDRERCLAVGMDGYVCKPIDLVALFREIDSVTSTAV
jgi:signal transduction histidine kinase/CheY-like chemotaxis protein